jgi:hypothetical protein
MQFYLNVFRANRIGCRKRQTIWTQGEKSQRIWTLVSFISGYYINELQQRKMAYTQQFFPPNCKYYLTHFLSRCRSLWRNWLKALTADQKVSGSIPTRAKAKWGYLSVHLNIKIVLVVPSCRVPTPPSTGSLVSVWCDQPPLKYASLSVGAKQ